MALGDSLTAGYGLPPGQGYPEQVLALLRQAGQSVEIVNAGVSGDTSTGGLERLDWSVGDGVDGVIVALGANDALRGIAPEITRGNLDRIIERLKARGIAVLVAGMLAPPNMGDAYARAFNALYPELAAKHQVLLMPFLLDGVAAVPDLNLADGMHPNAKGAAVIAKAMLPSVEELLRRIGPR